MPCSYPGLYCARHGEIRVAAFEEEPTRYNESFGGVALSSAFVPHPYEVGRQCETTTRSVPTGFISARIRRTYMSFDFPFSASDTSTGLSRSRSWLSRFRPGIIQLACTNLIPLKTPRHCAGARPS